MDQSPRILGWVWRQPGKDAGVAYRSEGPLRALNRRGWTIALSDGGIRRTDLTSLDVLASRKRFVAPSELKEFRALCDGLGVVWSWDADDADFSVPRFSPTYRDAKREEPMHRRILESIDLLTVSTIRLAVYFARYTGARIAVCPNGIEPARWEAARALRAQKPADYPLTVGVRGSPYHVHQDWKLLVPVWREIARLYPAVHFVTRGADAPYFHELGRRYHPLGLVPLDRYPESLAWIDIACGPLRDDEFNRGKSPILWMEHGILGVPVVASPTVFSAVVHPGQDGFLAKTTEEWIERLARLIESEELRATVGKAARLSVLARHTTDAAAGHWDLAYRDALARKRGTRSGMLQSG